MGLLMQYFIAHPKIFAKEGGYRSSPPLLETQNVAAEVGCEPLPPRTRIILFFSQNCLT